MSKKNAPKNLVLQFRAGEWVGSRVLDMAASWKVTPHEVGRRLMMLALFRLTMDHYPVIERLADAVGGGNNFLRACDMVLAASHADDLTRKESKKKPRTEQDRVAFLERWVQEFASGSHGLSVVPRVQEISDQTMQEPGSTAQGGEQQPYRRFNLDHLGADEAADPGQI